MNLLNNRMGMILSSTIPILHQEKGCLHLLLMDLRIYLYPRMRVAPLKFYPLVLWHSNESMPRTCAEKKVMNPSPRHSSLGAGKENLKWLVPGPSLGLIDVIGEHEMQMAPKQPKWLHSALSRVGIRLARDTNWKVECWYINEEQAVVPVHILLVSLRYGVMGEEERKWKYLWQ